MKQIEKLKKSKVRGCPGARYTEVNDMKQERKKKEKKRGKISFFYMHTELMMDLLCVCGGEKRGPVWRGETIKRCIYCSPHIILMYIYGVVDMC